MTQALRAYTDSLVEFQCSRVNRRYVTGEGFENQDMIIVVSVFSCEPKICDPPVAQTQYKKRHVSVFSCEPKICDLDYARQPMWNLKFQCSRVNRRYVTKCSDVACHKFSHVSVFSCEPKICDRHHIFL